MRVQCRESLPKAKEQPPDADAADSSPGSGSGAAMSAADPPGSASGWPGGRSGGATGGSKGTSPRESGGSPGATAAPSGGPRRIPADIRPPEHGGLFHGGALAGRKKDTGGVGACLKPTTGWSIQYEFPGTGGHPLMCVVGVCTPRTQKCCPP